MGDNPHQDLTSPHITREPSATSTATMEVISKSWDDVINPPNTESWGPPVIKRKDNAWQEDAIQSQRVPRRILQTKTEEWVNSSTITKPKKVEQNHPVSSETSDFLSNMVSSMRDGVNSNTTVMSLLTKPVSVFEEPEVISKDLDMGEQERINKELEEFLLQIREIRDGPTQPTVQGDIAEEITEHLTEQKAAVEDALAALDRELTQDSGVNGSEAEHEEEFKRLVMEREATITTQSSHNIPDQMSNQLSRPSSQGSYSTQQTMQNQEDERVASTQPTDETLPPPFESHKRMGLYELLALHPDPKVRKAAQKMKRLDEQLKLVIQKEREVKRQREMLNKQMLVYNSGSQLIATQESTDDMTVITDLRSEVTPIFATQIDGEEEDTCSLPSISSRVSMTTKTSPRSAKSQSNKSRDQTPRSEQSRGKTQQTRVKTQQTRTQSKQSNFSRREDKNKRNNKNFIARNKELANDASAVIAMTEEEKRRLQELLCDVDTLDETVDESTIAVIDDGGFRANCEEEKRLKVIESLLIVEEGSAMSLCSGLTDASILSIQSRAVEELNEKCNVDADKLGESALQALIDKKGEEERLSLIDQMLERLTGEEQEELPEVPKSVLDELLAQCRTESARLSAELPEEQSVSVL